MLNTQKIISNTLKSQNFNNEFINEYVNNEDIWCNLKFNNNIFLDYDVENGNENENENLNNRETYLNNINSCKHLYSNIFNISNMNDKTNYVNNFNKKHETGIKYNENIIANDNDIGNNFNKFEYIKSINKVIFFNNNNIISGEFTLYQFIKYLIKNIDKHNIFFRNITLNPGDIYFIENNICITSFKSNTNMCIKLTTSSIMENINFLFLFNNLIYSYKMNNLLDDLENIDDVLQNKIIIIYDQFIYLLINHTLKIILAKSLHCKNDDQYDKMSSLLIYRMSKLVHSQLMTHIQMNINITNYLNMIKEIHDDFSKKIKRELKSKKKTVNIFTESFEKNNINESTSDANSLSSSSSSSSLSMNEIISSNKLTSNEQNMKYKEINESSNDITSLNKPKTNISINNTNSPDSKNINKNIIENKNISLIKDKINFDLDKILSEITS